MIRRLAIIGILLAATITTPAQGPELNAVMRDKLDHAQRMLEAVVTSDWVGLETHSRELERLTSDPRWMILKYPEYARHSSTFLKAIQALHRAAAQRDQEETPKAYVAVTLSCIECHQYLARERIARGTAIDSAGSTAESDIRRRVASTRMAAAH